MKRIIPIIVGVAILAVSILVTNTNISASNIKLAEQTRQINDLKNKIETKQQSLDDTEKKLVKNSTGLDSERLNKDNQIASDFASAMFTWSSGDEYEARRKTMVDTYKISPQSSMLTVLFPKDTVVKQPDGSKLSYITTHKLNSTFEKLETYVSKIQSGVYSYFAFITWSASDDKGNEGKTTAVLTYDIDASGNMSNIDGYTVSQ